MARQPVTASLPQGAPAAPRAPAPTAVVVTPLVAPDPALKVPAAVSAPTPANGTPKVPAAPDAPITLETLAAQVVAPAANAAPVVAPPPPSRPPAPPAPLAATPPPPPARPAAATLVARVEPKPAEPRPAMTPDEPKVLIALDPNERHCTQCGRDVTGRKFCPEDGTPVPQAGQTTPVAAKLPTPPPVSIAAPVVQQPPTPPPVAAPVVATPPPAPAPAPVAKLPAPAAPSELSVWHISTGTSTHGPMRTSDVVTHVKSGRITRGMQLWREGIEWTPVERFADFAQHLPTVQPPAAPPVARPPALAPVIATPPPHAAPIPTAHAAYAPPDARSTATAAPPQQPQAPVKETVCGNAECRTPRYLPTDKRCRVRGCGYIFKS